MFQESVASNNNLVGSVHNDFNYEKTLVHVFELLKKATNIAKYFFLKKDRNAKKQATLP